MHLHGPASSTTAYWNSLHVSCEQQIRRYVYTAREAGCAAWFRKTLVRRYLKLRLLRAGLRIGNSKLTVPYYLRLRLAKVPSGSSTSPSRTTHVGVAPTRVRRLQSLSCQAHFLVRARCIPCGYASSTRRPRLRIATSAASSGLNALDATLSGLACGDATSPMQHIWLSAATFRRVLKPYV